MTFSLYSMVYINKFSHVCQNALEALHTHTNVKGTPPTGRCRKVRFLQFLGILYPPAGDYLRQIFILDRELLYTP